MSFCPAPVVTADHTYTETWFDTTIVNCYPNNSPRSRIPVISPFCLPSTFSRSSNNFKNLSNPCASVLLIARNPRQSNPTAPMTKVEPARHGALGATGCSSGSGRSVIAGGGGTSGHGRRKCLRNELTALGPALTLSGWVDFAPRANRVWRTRFLRGPDMVLSFLPSKCG